MLPAVAVVVVIVSGCSGHAEHDSGSLRCIGMCELTIDHSEATKVVESTDGTVTTETEGNGGLGNRNSTMKIEAAE